MIHGRAAVHLAGATVQDDGCGASHKRVVAVPREQNATERRIAGLGNLQNKRVTTRTGTNRQRAPTFCSIVNLQHAWNRSTKYEDRAAAKSRTGVRGTHRPGSGTGAVSPAAAALSACASWRIHCVRLVSSRSNSLAQECSIHRSWKNQPKCSRVMQARTRQPASRRAGAIAPAACICSTGSDSECYHGSPAGRADMLRNRKARTFRWTEEGRRTTS
jgi:hypothetical protein